MARFYDTHAHLDYPQLATELPAVIDRARAAGIEKIIAGVRRACQGRGVGEDALARLAQHVEEQIRASGSAEVPSREVGLAILGPLRELDEVAYLRFASVYRDFASLADFETEIAMLRAERGETVPEPVRQAQDADRGQG